MPTLQELNYILLKNNIKGGSYLDKPKIIELLAEKNLFHTVKSKPPAVNPQYPQLSKTRLCPRRVTLKDIETEKELPFPSLYKAARFIGKSTCTISHWNERVWNNEYYINILYFLFIFYSCYMKLI